MISKEQYQKALDELKYHFENPRRHYWNMGANEPQKYFDILQELIDKETPIKPKIEQQHDYVECHYVCSYEICLCPKCGVKISYADEYCSDCGQKINWSEKDE